MDLALFDFDGTITTRDTMSGFMLAAVRPGRLVVGKVIFLPLLLGYKFGIVSGSVVRAGICLFGFWRVPSAELEQRGAEFAATLSALQRPEAMERLAWHKARGDKVVVVSGGLDVYLRHWAEANDVELICSSLAQRAGRLTGLYHGRQCVRREKARRVLAAYPVEDFPKVFAYGDTSEDRELLALAHEAYYRWQRLTPVEAGGC